MMARQVRPWLAQPAPDEAPRVRVSDRGADQQNPSGTASTSRTQSPDVRVQSLPSRRHELRAWQTGGVHVRPMATVLTWGGSSDWRLPVGSGGVEARVPGAEPAPDGRPDRRVTGQAMINRSLPCPPMAPTARTRPISTTAPDKYSAPPPMNAASPATGGFKKFCRGGTPRWNTPWSYGCNLPLRAVIE